MQIRHSDIVQSPHFTEPLKSLVPSPNNNKALQQVLAGPPGEWLGYATCLKHGREPCAQSRGPGQGDRPLYWGLELEGAYGESRPTAITFCSWRSPIPPLHLRGFRIRDRRITIPGENLVTWLLNTRLMREAMRN